MTELDDYLAIIKDTDDYLRDALDMDSEYEAYQYDEDMAAVRYEAMKESALEDYEAEAQFYEDRWNEVIMERYPDWKDDQLADNPQADISPETFKQAMIDESIVAAEAIADGRF